MYGYSPYSYSDPFEGLGFFVFIALVLAILTVIFVTPEKRRAQLNSFFKVLADICNFKGLFLESIFKFLYIFSTYSVILTGVFLFFKGLFSDYFGSEIIWSALAMMFIMPIFIRIIYELFMMTIIMVKNIIQINRKIKAPESTQGTPANEAPQGFANPATVFTQQKEPTYVFCGNCGTKYDPSQGGCPNGCAH